MADFDYSEEDGEDSFEAYLSRRTEADSESTEEVIDASVDEVIESIQEEFPDPIVVDVEDHPIPERSGITYGFSREGTVVDQSPNKHSTPDKDQTSTEDHNQMNHPDRTVSDKGESTQEMRAVKTRRFHEMTGPYIHTELIPVQNFSWRSEVWNNTYHLAIDEMTADQIEKVIEENEEAIAKVRTQSHALQAAKEEKLLDMNPEEREAYIARRAKSKPRLKKDKDEDSKELTRTKSGSIRPRNKVEKAILTFKNMDLTKEELREEAKVLNYLNPDTEEFINALYDEG